MSRDARSYLIIPLGVALYLYLALADYLDPGSLGPALFAGTLIVLLFLSWVFRAPR